MKILRTTAIALLLSAIAAPAMSADLPRYSLPEIRMDTPYNGKMMLIDSPDWSGGGTQQDFRIRLNAGDIVKIEGKSDDFDIAVLLYDDSEQVGEDDDGGQGTDAKLVARVNKTGMHTVRVFNPWVSRMGNGNFTLKISRAGEDELNEDDAESGCGCSGHHHSD